MPSVQKITPCLWFDDRGEAAATFYTGAFPNPKITNVTRYGEAGHEVHGKEPGTVLTAPFQLDGHALTALNGGPEFKFGPAGTVEIRPIVEIPALPAKTYPS